MRSAAVAALAVLALAGCGGGTKTVTVEAKRPLSAPAQASCVPALGKGVMGACVPLTRTLTAAPAPRAGRALIPDTSEYQGCYMRPPGIYRAYEAGTGREDTRAACHARELRSGWRAAYFFARPPGYYHALGCQAQADRFYGIVRMLGGVDVYVIDAEVPLPAGFDDCVRNRLVRDGAKVVCEYASPGTASGGPFRGCVWGATYGQTHGCIEAVCSWQAWQFSEAYDCRGVFGDCSYDLGITSLGSDRAALEGRIRALRRVLANDGCRARVRRHERLGPRCRRWFAEGQRDHRLLGA